MVTGTPLGYFGRVKNSLIGVLFGLVLIPASVVLLSWNEYRTVQRSRGLAEAANVVQSVRDLEAILPDLDNSLVHLTGRATTNQVVIDPDFQVVSNGLRLERRVEYFQWHEERISTKKQSTKSDAEPEYRHETGWTSKPIDSDKFRARDRDLYRNPKPKVLERTFDAATIQVGIFELSGNLKTRISNWTAVSIDSERVIAALPEVQRPHYTGNTEFIYFSAKPTAITAPSSSTDALSPQPESNRDESSQTPIEPGISPPTTPSPPVTQNTPQPTPQVGDVRITYVECLPTDVSIVAKLNGKQLSEYRTSNGEPFERLFMGSLSAEQIMSQLVSENTVFAWFLRFAGVFVCFLGFYLVLNPISAMASFVPFLGQLAGGLIGVAALLLALSVSLVTIAIAWIVVRPVLAVALLIMAAVGIYLLLRLRNSNSPIRTPGFAVEGKPN